MKGEEGGEARDGLGRWRLALLAGALPLLVVGFVASGLANRLAFAGWALVAAFGYAVLLRHGWERWPRSRSRGAALVWLAAAVAAFGGLAERHAEILDLGARALLWPLYHPLLTRPATAWVLAGLLAAAAALTLAGGRRMS